MSGDLAGKQLRKPSGELVDAEAALGGCEVVMLYFSAHWCPPCKMFTPKLIAWYKKAKEEKGLSVEIVFVSSDHSQQEFEAYAGSMPWLAVPFGDEATRRRLGTSFMVMGIPKLVVCEAVDLKTITTDGRGAVLSDPEAEQFPYRDYQGSSWCLVL